MSKEFIDNYKSYLRYLITYNLDVFQTDTISMHFSTENMTLSSLCILS